MKSEPAFPYEYSDQKGMTLRDYFAIRFACVEYRSYLADEINEFDINTAYRLADDLIKERNK